MDTDKIVEEMFTVHDKNKNGLLQPEELNAVLEAIFGKLGHPHKVSDDEVKQYLKKYDKNNDGKISPVELKAIVKDIMSK